MVTKHSDLHLPLIFYFIWCFGFEDDASEGSEFPLLSHYFCTELLPTITTYYCLTLQNAEAPLENNSDEEYLRIMINGITIKYLNMND